MCGEKNSEKFWVLDDNWTHDLPDTNNIILFMWTRGDIVSI